MVANRQDAWTPDDDLLLAEVTLRYIREGGTQLRAFEEVAERLGRTSAACGFRWNSAVRKNYEAAIAIAKGQRQKNKLKRIHSKKTEKVDSKASNAQAVVDANEQKDFEALIQFLKNQKQIYQDMQNRNRYLEVELKKKERELEALQREHTKMLNEHTTAKSVNDDYLALVQIMDRARKLALLEAEEKPIFKMDSNGNLERVNK